MCGYNAGIIQKCTTTDGNIKFYSNGNLYVGLIAGMNSGTIENAVATGNISIAPVSAKYCHGSAGGVAGEIASSGTIENCLAMGTIINTAHNGVSGDIIAKGNGKVTNCYRNRMLGGQTLDIKSAAEASSTSLNSKTFYTGTLKWSSEIWNFSAINAAMGKYPVLIF